MLKGVRSNTDATPSGYSGSNHKAGQMVITLYNLEVHGPSFNRSFVNDRVNCLMLSIGTHLNKNKLLVKNEAAGKF